MLLRAIQLTGSVTILTGNGDGTFSIGSAFGANGAATIAAADLNGGGLLGIASTNGNSVSVIVDYLAATAQATLANALANAGTTNVHEIQCTYPGDANYQATTSNPFGETYSPAATPVFSLLVGEYPASQPVTITDASAGASIYFTTDGSQPSASSPPIRDKFSSLRRRLSEQSLSGLDTFRPMFHP